MSFEKKIEQLLEDYQARGTITVVFDKNGKLFYENTWGFANMDSCTRIDKDTIMGIASMSKSFVALGIMQLVEQGTLDLDEKVHTYIPKLVGGQREEMTVKHLLYHAAGFPQLHRTTVYEVLEEMACMERGSQNYPKDISRNPQVAKAGFEKILALLNGVNDFAGTPGEAFVYSNDSYAILTELIRKYGDEASFADYINEHIFVPLGMSRSTYRFIFPDSETNITTLYRREDDVETKDAPEKNVAYIATNDFYDNAYVLMGGGNVKSTINNLIPYVCFYLNGNDAILQQDLLNEMIVPRIDTSENEAYGYGLFEYKLPFGTCFGHSGSLTGVSSNMMWSKEHGVGCIVLSNTTNVPAKEIAAILLENFCK